MEFPPSHHSAAPAATGDAAKHEGGPAPRVYWAAAGSLDARAVERLTAELSQDETRQARSFAFEADRGTYVVAHAMLHRVLLDRLGGEEPHILRSRLGRPELAPAPGGGPLPSFNLTHTRGFAACAVVERAPIGIDAEDIRRPIEIDAIAARWFAAPERRMLEQCRGQSRTDLFFRIWTIKEAILKATGHGLRIEPQGFAVDPEHGATAIPPGLGIPTQWRLAELCPLPHIRLAVAVPGAGPLDISATHLDLG